MELFDYSAGLYGGRVLRVVVFGLTFTPHSRPLQAHGLAVSAANAAGATTHQATHTHTNTGQCTRQLALVHTAVAGRAAAGAAASTAGGRGVRGFL